MIVGLVGKPNVGKSTFFSAATLIPVPIANRPFTTIHPNHGIGYVRVPCVCRELGVEDEPSNSLCTDGIRLIPIELIDCAGLVPDSWKGKGLGNYFLDEIRRADALIHIIDAAGATDEEGRQCKPGMNDPRNDVKFLKYEITMWLVQLIQKDWKRMCQRVETTSVSLLDLLSDKLSGLAITKGHLTDTLKKTKIDASIPSKWNNDDLVRFAFELQKTAKPIIIAANKIDIPSSEDNVNRLQVDCKYVYPCSAEAELILRRAAQKELIEYSPGDSDFELLALKELTSEQKHALTMIKEKVLMKWGTTGVQDVINAAFLDVLQMIAVYPVENIELFSDHKGQVLPDVHLLPRGTTAKQLAYKIHSDLGTGFLYALDARSKRRLGEGYILKNCDIIKVVSTKGRR
jgi:ribosome-binding ATPase YchF (GTP1/OBG family)